MSDLLEHAFLFLHFLGLATLLGGLLAQWTARPRTGSPLLLWAAILQLVTGLALTWIEFEEVNHIKVTVKFAILIVILVVLAVRNRKELTGGAYGLLIGLTVANIGLAVFW